MLIYEFYQSLKEFGQQHAYIVAYEFYQSPKKFTPISSMHYIFLLQECRYRIALPENYTIKFSCDDFGLQVGCSGVLEPNAHGCAFAEVCAHRIRTNRRRRCITI